MYKLEFLKSARKFTVGLSIDVNIARIIFVKLWIAPEFHQTLDPISTRHIQVHKYSSGPIKNLAHQRSHCFLRIYKAQTLNIWIDRSQRFLDKKKVVRVVVYQYQGSHFLN